ncbi:YveK family protein [Limosilactobacillus reuteri subsp. suis]|uniref:Chain-length determining protein n=1 Tax=Limosilactobacillus reuteri TaxID=1598 RepID=A0AAP7NNQ2_LIMRT|nr:hypothetical protein [Limosilactobacillus reuteri]AMY14664.1 chain-length determining protein [Limosilactobacillus reuteri]MCC4387378.1 chain-length determining protein [Limosilactobacillus reuteri]MCC4389560.1 chain-length determining protein [Limosilactobacillus reuteri]MCC4391580.1 chain-length determining protein [Limosilactobacillus reuteri]MCC4393204.1 chain-length determining protein [Limosilactobacillus reuteri]
MKEYRLKDLSASFWKGLIITIIFAIIGGIGMGLLARHRQSTSYIAERSVVITHKISESELSQGNNQQPIVITDLNMMDTYSDIAQNKQIASAARKYLPKKLQHEYSADTIASDVNAMTHSQSLVMKIKVKTGDAKDSATIANAVTRAFQKELPKVQPGAGQVHLLAKATSENVQISTTPNKKKYIAAGVALGALIGIVISFVTVTWRKYIK